MMYSFEGNFRRRPEQNLSGASQKPSRDLLLQRVHQERLKRQEERLRSQSILLLQSSIRSYIVRKHIKAEQRLIFDNKIATCENINQLKLHLCRLCFFYNVDTDVERLLQITEKLIICKSSVLTELECDSRLIWLIKRYLSLCIQVIHVEEVTGTLLKSLDIYTGNSNEEMKIDIWPYLMSKNYFKQLRKILDSYDKETNCILNLIQRPFESLHSNSTQTQCERILSDFCKHFLKSKITPTIRNSLIPHLRATNVLPYEELIRFLNNKGNCECNNNLLYCILALEPAEFEQSKESIQVLSYLTSNLYALAYVENISDDSDSDEMECDEGHIFLRDYINIFNNTERVKKTMHFFNHNSEDEEILLSLTQLCHHLLLIYEDAIHKFMLVYMLSLHGTFLSKLWIYINKHNVGGELSQSSGSLQGAWKDTHTAIAVYCSMFTLYSATLTDTETHDPRSVFTSEEFATMADIFKNIAMNLIDVAFPMCRPVMVNSSPEMIHLYNSCLKTVKVLHTLDLRKYFCKPGFWTRRKIHISPYLAKKNYLSRTLKPFHGLVFEDEGEHLPPLSTIELRCLAILQHLPFLIEFNTRILLLRELCRSALGDTDRMGFNLRDFVADRAVVIRRTHLYEDSFEKLSLQNESDLKQKVRIQFINTAGLEEPGIDGGGIFKEFINEALKTAFDPNRGFFLLTNDNQLYPNPNVNLIVENFQEHYYFIGRLLGKAIYENILVDLPLADFFLAKLLVDRVETHHLRSLDPILYRNLLYLKDYEGDVQDIGLDFTAVSSELGETIIVELKRNGKNIPVTNYNRLEYIYLLADYKLNGQIKKQCLKLREGLDNVVPLIWLKLFSYKELQVIIGGDTQEMDINDLKAHTTYGGDFKPDHPTIILFWKIVEAFTDVEKKKLLKFVTSCSRPPLLGFRELIPSFSIQSAGSEDRMPTASTCLNLLKIPIITEEQILRDKLLSAIEQQAGFELS